MKGILILFGLRLLLIMVKQAVPRPAPNPPKKAEPDETIPPYPMYIEDDPPVCVAPFFDVAPMGRSQNNRILPEQIFHPKGKAGWN
jgi:hypothetical protein